VSMINYETGEPNPRYWVLKLIHDNYGPGDKLVETSISSGDLSEEMTAQAFVTSKGKSLLLINRRDHPQQLQLPADAAGASVTLVAPATGDHAPAQEILSSREITLQPFEVAMVQYR